MGLDDIRSAVAERLPAYAAPAFVWFLDEPLPRNANGKFLKRELKSALNVADAVS